MLGKPECPHQVTFETEHKGRFIVISPSCFPTSAWDILGSGFHLIFDLIFAKVKPQTWYMRRGLGEVNWPTVIIAQSPLWEFPKIRVPPIHLVGFSIIKHPAIGVPRWLWKPQYHPKSCIQLDAHRWFTPCFEVFSTRKWHMRSWSSLQGDLRTRRRPLNFCWDLTWLEDPPEKTVWFSGLLLLIIIVDIIPDSVFLFFQDCYC
jgi:hypothetical protein